MWLVQLQTLADRTLKYLGLQRIPQVHDWREVYHAQDVRGNSVLRIVWNESPYDDPGHNALGYVYYEGGGLEDLSDEWWFLIPKTWDYKEALAAYEIAKSKGDRNNWRKVYEAMP